MTNRAVVVVASVGLVVAVAALLVACGAGWYAWNVWSDLHAAVGR